MVEPSAIHPLGLSGDAFETEAQTTDDAKRCVVVRRCSHTDAMCPHVTKRKLDGSSGCFRHEPSAHAFFAEPITKIALTMDVHARLETHHANERAACSFADAETQSAAMIPIRHTRFGKTLARCRFGVVRDPRKPLLQERPGPMYGKPNLL